MTSLSRMRHASLCTRTEVAYDPQDMLPVSVTEPPLTERRVILIVLIIAVAAFMQMLDGAILSTAIPQMARSFAISPVALGIGITAYVMANAILLPAAGWLADRIGARRLFVGAIIAFTIASVLCGMSTTLPQFVAARIVQGLGGAMMTPVGSIILMRIIPRRDLLRMMNIFSAPMLIAPVLGPPIGGLITTWFGWSWIFYLNVPVGLLGAALTLRFVPGQPRLKRPFDGGGFLLNGVALGALIYGFGELGGGLPHAVAAAFIALGIGCGLIAIRHSRRHDHPLLSLVPVRYSTYTLTTVFALPFIRLPVVALPFALPIMLQVGFGLTAFASGMLFLAHTLGDLAMKLIIGRAFARFGYRSAMMANVVGFAATIAACALFTRQTPFATMAALLFAAGCFRSFLGSGMGTLSYAEVPPEEMTHATTLNQVVMQLAQAIGVSLTVIAIDLATALRGGAVVDAGDCRVALVVVAIVSLLALVPLWKLAPDAGAELSGHKRSSPERGGGSA